METTSPTIRASMTTSPTATDDWRVETPRPADRGLVARLLEQVLAADASVAPEVASGAQRPGAWLQRVRPAWSGVVVDPSAASRTIVGYAAVVTEPGTGRHVLHDVLVAPGFAERGVEPVLLAGAADAITSLAAAPPPEPREVSLEIAPATYPEERVERPRRRAAIVGAALIVALGTAGVLAIQVGISPFGASLPFFSPSGVERTSDEPGSSPQPAPSPSPQVVVPAGQPIALQPSTGPTSGPTGGPTGGPTADPSPTDEPTSTPSQPPAAPGLTSSLLDPVVTTVVDSVDELTGGAVAPVTGTVKEAGDGLTDTVDGLLPPLTR